MRVFLAGVLALAATGAAHAEPVAQSAEAVLAANHTAVGDAPAAGSAKLDYEYTASGMTGTLSDTADLATGAFVETQFAEGIGAGEGYDGKIPWMRDISGANTPQEGGDRIPVAVNKAYRFANLWWRSDRGGAAIVYAGRETADGRAFDHLTVTPKGGKRFDAWFDAETHLLDHIAEDRQFFHTQTRYGDYRREGGLLLAHAVTFDVGLGADALETSKLTGFSVGPEQPLSAYSRPTAAPTGASIDGGAASVTVPFRLLNNHIYVEAKVNGKGPYTLLVDTGGHTLLSPRLVSDLGLKSVGQTTMSGAGEGHSTSGYAHFDEIAIGGVRLRDQIGFATEIYDPSIEGIRVDGMVGFELFRRMAVQVDYGRQTMTFTDPARFTPKDAGTAIPFVFYDHLPNVQGLVGDLPAHFDIDTGSRSEMDITSPFVAAHQLRAKFSKGVSAVNGWGVGGPARSYVVRMPAVTLGGIKAENVVAGLSESKNGSISDPNYSVNVGSGFLKRFVATFDYAHQTMYLKPIVPPPVDAGRFDRSGLWINAKAEGYEVTDVATGSAGAQAGFAVGDMIVAIDGRPLRPEGLSDTRILLRAKPVGTKVQMQVRRGAETRNVTLVLQDQI